MKDLFGLRIQSLAQELWPAPVGIRRGRGLKGLSCDGMDIAVQERVREMVARQVVVVIVVVVASINIIIVVVVGFGRDRNDTTWKTGKQWSGGKVRNRHDVEAGTRTQSYKTIFNIYNHSHS